ncbi:hypothetical protein MNR02_17700 (plasmid) [Shinella sp. H4-D48]|jgi:hypothetical protein|uniref:Uncharacterized protein n=1 Tax=Shinella sedimenti TaxID=2919913 RepID=A0ABT0CN11_9HYPH|nr:MULTISPECIES: hypothetical protein [Shinella]MCJ8149985.1 hypothetical protein [Shinella sedimenti]UNK40350.1 hypothetical protein MNR02_17700 [Shinella sp. H4-D48]
MTRLALLERLKAVQQMPKFERRDITTIAAILNTKALARHVEVCESDAGITRPGVDVPNGPA